MWARPLRGDRDCRDAEVPPTLLRLADLMFERGDFMFHLTQTNPSQRAARFVEEINNPAGRAAEKDNEKTHRANQLCYRHGHTAKIAQHDLQNLFAQPDAGKTNRQRGEGAFNRMHGNKIDNLTPA